MKISVVLAIYNGEAFLKEQVRSLLNQTKSIDQFVIVNDASTDDSISIVKDLLDNENVVFINNKENQGPVKAFEKGIKKATGEIIFLCDQDDIWLPHKVVSFYQSFQEGAHFVFSDAKIIDENGNETNSSFIDSLGTTPKEKILLLENNSDKVLSKKNVISGACSAFLKSELKKEFFPFIYHERHMLHDRFLGNLFSATDSSKVHFIPEPLIHYRIHHDQFIGLNTKVDTENISRTAYFEAEANLLEHTLSRVENVHFRRAHYFWFMRSQLHKLPFLRKFISINTLFLEGDYKRNCKNGIRQAISDLRL